MCRLADGLSYIFPVSLPKDIVTYICSVNWELRHDLNQCPLEAIEGNITTVPVSTRYPLHEEGKVVYICSHVLSYYKPFLIGYEILVRCVVASKLGVYSIKATSMLPFTKNTICII